MARVNRVLAAAILIFVIGLVVNASAGQFENNFTVHFFDVGQGDAISVHLPQNQDILIDGGANNHVSRKLGRTLPFFDRFIDMVILTHPDGDHITGLIDVIRTYRVGAVLMPAVSRTTDEYVAFMEMIKKKKVPVLYARAGQVFEFASGITLEIFSSGSDEQLAHGLLLNNSSVVAKLTYHEIDLLFTGDITSAGENELLATGKNLSSEVLKVPHHGSRFSTSSAFIQAVHPSVAILSSGKSNPYGHPHWQTLQRLAEEKVSVLRTDTAGDITFKSDGKTFEFITERK